MNVNEGRLGSNNNHPGKTLREKHKTDTLLLSLTPFSCDIRRQDIGVLACIYAQTYNIMFTVYNCIYIYTMKNIYILYIQMFNAHIICVCFIHSTNPDCIAHSKMKPIWMTKHKQDL